MTLKEYIQHYPSKNYTQIAKLIPCAKQYISMIANEKKTPSYRMACRIEQVTDGKVTRHNWYE